MNWNELDLKQLGSWPVSVRIIVLAGAFVLILFLGYWFLIKPQITNLYYSEKQYRELQSRYQSDSKNVAVLPQYEKQLTQKQKALEQSTASQGITPMIYIISNLAMKNNLKINSIKPRQENEKAFFMTQPIDFSVMGDYQHLVAFMSELNASQKAIGMDDFTLSALNRKAEDDVGSTLLMMNAIFYGVRRNPT